MADRHLSRARSGLIVVLVLAVVVFSLQLFIVRPHSWPAGGGFTLSDDGVLVPFNRPTAIPRMRPPNADVGLTREVRVVDVTPASPAADSAVAPDVRILRIRTNASSDIDLAGGLPSDPATVLRAWRQAYWMGTREPVTLTLGENGATRDVTLDRPSLWALDNAGRVTWLRTHAGPLLQTAAFIAGAIVLVALGTRGMTAILMTLALVATAIANSGALMGEERAIPMAREVLVLFGWLTTPFTFPIIGLAVLYFPSRADILDRHRWIVPAILAAAAPMFIISLCAALFLLGVDTVLPGLSWLASHSWTFDASFAIALAANVLIVIEGIRRYQTNLDQNERRRIQMVVFTGVPAVFSYAIRVGVPMLSSLFGRPIQLHWVLETLLLAVMLLPAFGLPYVVLVRHVLSPRTVLRRSLQYALARRTLSVLVILPIAAFVITLIVQDRPLGDIVLGQPLFSVVCLVLAAFGLKYRERAQRWLDRRFFRAEYDAREILVSLAGRVPYESDPRELVTTVLTQIDSALHPESVAVLAGDAGAFDLVGALRSTPEGLPRDNALVTLLRWSEEPLEVFLDDERSPAARLPQLDREWLAASGVQLLVPIFTGSTSVGERLMIGIILLGAKRSEEPYTAEDRKLLSGIAGQMSVALDLSRLRKRVSDTGPTVLSRSATPTLPPTMLGAAASTAAGGLIMCPECWRCYDGNSGISRCPDDNELLQSVVGMPPIVDGKYRVDAAIGRGGMGAVFRARDTRLDRDVAIKIVRAEFVADADARARFLREAQVVARLQHPAVVTVFDYGNLADGAAFIVMEFVRGEDLRNVLNRERTLTPTRTLELMTGIAMGVEAAHAAGVLHRDLKPENVLLPAGGGGPKVLDFGVAKITEMSVGGGTTITQGATIVGTPAYMAPEQLRGDKVDGRVDVFSLGVMTYEALTGLMPYGMGSLIDIGMKQASGASVIDVSRLPERTATVLLRTLAYDRQVRPATPAAFVEELKTAL